MRRDVACPGGIASTEVDGVAPQPVMIESASSVDVCVPALALRAAPRLAAFDYPRAASPRACVVARRFSPYDRRSFSQAGGDDDPHTGPFCAGDIGLKRRRSKRRGRAAAKRPLE